MAQTVWTILGLIRWADERFRKEGLPTPRLDAEILLAESLGTDRVGLYTHFDQPLKSDELARFKTLLLRRLRREPVAYILGRKEFWSLPFKVSRDVLIPRPETEILVSEALKIISERNVTFPRILEIGTGSGAIAVALAKEVKKSFLVATDISRDALILAKENARSAGVQDQIEFVIGDLFGPLRPPREKEPFDLILSNPPYIVRRKICTLAKEVKDYEPTIALDGGRDGLAFYRRIIPEAHSYLRAGGWLLLEVALGQGPEVSEWIEGEGHFFKPECVPDLSGIGRVVKAQKRRD